MKRDDMSAEKAHRTPPHSVEAEQSVLGGLLVDNAAWDRVGDRLLERDFYSHQHRLIFGAIGSLLNAAKPADVVTVLDALRRRGTEEECGGEEYLSALSLSVPSASNIGAYADIIRGQSARRELISVTAQLNELAWDDAAAPEDIRDRIAAAMAQLEQRTSPREPRAVGQILAERLDHLSALASGDAVPGIPTGLPNLDRALGGGIKPGKVIVTGARPSVGKTSLAGHVALAVAAQGHAVLILSQEMTAGELVDRLLANAAGVQLGDIATGQLDQDSWGRISSGAEDLVARPLLIDDTPALSLLQIRAKARQVKRQHGLALLVVDYLQLCSAPAGTERRHHQIEVISRGMKQLAKELDCCVMLLSQLSRASAESEPELHDLKESGSIEEDADVVMLLHPFEKQADGTLLVLLKLAKNRQGRRGRIGLTFDGRLQRWEESTASVARRRGQGGEA